MRILQTFNLSPYTGFFHGLLVFDSPMLRQAERSFELELQNRGFSGTTFFKGAEKYCCNPALLAIFTGVESSSSVGSKKLFCIVTNSNKFGVPSTELISELFHLNLFLQNRCSPFALFFTYKNFFLSGFRLKILNQAPTTLCYKYFLFSALRLFFFYAFFFIAHMFLFSLRFTFVKLC